MLVWTASTIQPLKGYSQFIPRTLLGEISKCTKVAGGPDVQGLNLSLKVNTQELRGTHYSLIIETSG